MHHRLLSESRSSALAVGFAVLLTGGGLALAATTSSSVIHACANKKTGALRIADRCRHGERRVSWNRIGRTGPAGRRGPSGARGAAGNKGATGPQGPAAPQGTTASAFTTTLQRGTGTTTLATFANGLKAVGECLSGGEINLFLETADGSSHLEASGTLALGNELHPADTEGAIRLGGFEKIRADVDVIAQNTAVGKFGRVDIHAGAGPSCNFWGMFIPAS